MDGGTNTGRYCLIDHLSQLFLSKDEREVAHTHKGGDQAKLRACRFVSGEAVTEVLGSQVSIDGLAQREVELRTNGAIDGPSQIDTQGAEKQHIE